MAKHKTYNDELLIVALARHEGATSIARRFGLTPSYVRRIARGAARADLQPHIQAARTGFDQELIRLAVPCAKALLARHVRLGMEGTNETARKCREFVLHFATSMVRLQQDRIDDIEAGQAEQEQLDQEQAEQEQAEQERARRGRPQGPRFMSEEGKEALLAQVWLEGGPHQVAEGDELILPPPPPENQSPETCEAAERGAPPVPPGEPVPWPGRPEDPNQKHTPRKWIVLDVPGRQRQYIPLSIARKLKLIPGPKSNYSRASFGPHS